MELRVASAQLMFLTRDFGNLIKTPEHDIGSRMRDDNAWAIYNIARAHRLEGIMTDSSSSPSPEQGSSRRGRLQRVHDGLKLWEGIVLTVVAIAGAIVGIPKLFGGDNSASRPAIASSSSSQVTTTPESFDEFCAEWQHTTQLNDVMAGFAQQTASSNGTVGASPDQVARVSNDLVVQSNQAAAVAPAEIRMNAKEYARQYNTIDQKLALNNYMLWSSTPEEAEEIAYIFAGANKEAIAVEIWARKNC